MHAREPGKGKEIKSPSEKNVIGDVGDEDADGVVNRKDNQSIKPAIPSMGGFSFFLHSLVHPRTLA